MLITKISTFPMGLHRSMKNLIMYAVFFTRLETFHSLQKNAQMLQMNDTI